MNRLLLALILIVGPAFPPRGCISAQETGQTGEWRIAGAASAFYRGGTRTKTWQPGFSGRIRFHFRHYFHAEVLLLNARTRRERFTVCDQWGSCPESTIFSGKADLLSAGFGLNTKTENWKPFLGIAYGRISDTNPHGGDGDPGPTWSGYVGVERRLTHRFKAFFEYRIHQQHRGNDLTGPFKDVRIRNHQIDLGFAFAARWDDLDPPPDLDR